jgi:hypothetical protein
MILLMSGPLIRTGKSDTLKGKKMSLHCALTIQNSEVMEGDSLAGTIILTNNSKEAIRIRYSCDPRQYIVFIVKDANGKVIKKKEYGQIFSPFAELQELTIKKNDHYTGSVVPIDKADRLTPGAYQLVAVYQYDSNRAQSSETKFVVRPRPKEHK